MRSTVARLSPLLAGLLLLGASLPTAGAASSSAPAPSEPDRVVALLDDPARDLAEPLDGIEHAVHAVSTRPPAASILLAPGDADAAIQRLEASEGISTAYEPRPVEARTVGSSEDADTVDPDDPFFDGQWAPQHVNLPEAWAEHGFGSHEVEVAILGGGIADGHEDLAPNVCRDLAGSSTHETRAAGMAAAVVNNTRGKAGAANACLVDLPLVQAGGLPGTNVPEIEHGGIGPCEGSNGPDDPRRLLCGEPSEDPLSGTSADVAFGLIAAASMDVDVVSVSFGVDRTPLLDAAIEVADARGVDLVFAAPNHAPCQTRTDAAYAKPVTAVANVDRNGDRVSPCPGLAAPGADVLTTDPGGAYAYVTGTSFAAPFAAGIAALALDAGAAPGTAGDLLEATATEGVVDAASALDAVDGPSTGAPASPEPAEDPLTMPHP